jgi:single-strand DNA-binding protein
MMPYFNKVVLIGRLGADPEIKQVGDGKWMAVASLAVSRDDEAPMWVPVLFFGSQAENLHEITGKGDLLLVEGELAPDRPTKERPSKGNPTKVMAGRWVLLRKKGDGNASPEAQAGPDPSEGSEVPF